MLSLARLDKLCGQPLQRIGLSATIEPLERAAEYLAPEKVFIAAPKMTKKVRLDILSPYADASKGGRKDPIWEELGSLVYKYCQWDCLCGGEKICRKAGILCEYPGRGRFC